MSFVLASPVAMHWFFGDGKPQELAYAGKVLDAPIYRICRAFPYQRPDESGN